MKYPIGIQNFGKIRRDGYLYLDKTDLVYKMVNEGSYYFLSRPRRFGKSLLVSTLRAYFEGKRELFYGLALERLEHEWVERPVLHLDLNTREYKDESSLTAELNRHLEMWERQYGSEYADRATEERFLHIVQKAHEQTGHRVAILVDEYDKPLLQTLDAPELQETYRSKLKAFYSVLKTCDGDIKFALLTGVTKFGKVSVFSDLNNLADISMDWRYAALCGITEEEIRQCLDGEVEQLAARNGLTKEVCYDELRRNYDGYHFDRDVPGVYNPFSLLNTLSTRRFRSYWFETGTPSFLVEQLKKSGYNLEHLTTESLHEDALNSIDAVDRTPLPLLYQSGYLTIKSYDTRFKRYNLGFPNREVEEGLINYLIPYYTPTREGKTVFDVELFVKDVTEGRAGQFMKRLSTLFADSSYQIAGNAELYFHNAVYVIFKMMGFYVEVERATSEGRMDMVVKTDRYIYIFEFKINKNAAEALRQIEERRYAEAFALEERRIYRIGVNFDTATRSIDDWEIL